jgi:ubiquinone/menaquinone biosynthesis C-methylase UbiE
VSEKRIWEQLWSEKEYGELMKRRALGQEPEMEQIKQLTKLVRGVYKPGMKVLDVGCGAGHFYPSLRKIDKNISYVGVDISENYLKLARKIFAGEKNVKIGKEDIFGLKFKDGSFDIVICYMVLPFIPNWRKAVKELVRVTKRHLFIRLLLSDFTYIVKIYKKRHAENAPYEYYNIYSEKEFVNQLKAAGARKVKILEDEVKINIKRKKELPFSTYTYGKMQIIGNIVLTWKIVHASKRGRT